MHTPMNAAPETHSLVYAPLACLNVFFGHWFL